jgi:hypothetical protein
MTKSISIKLNTKEQRIAAMRLQSTLNSSGVEVMHSHSQDDDLIGCDIDEFNEVYDSLFGDDSGYCTGSDRDDMQERLDGLLDQDGDEWELWIHQDLIKPEQRGRE